MPGEEGVKYYIKEAALYLCCYHAEKLQRRWFNMGMAEVPIYRLKTFNIEKLEQSQNL